MLKPWHSVAHVHFLFPFFNPFPNVLPEWKYVVIKNKVLNWYEYSFPAHEYINWNVEQVLILDNQFFPIGEKFSKNHLYVVKCLHIICSYMAVCFIINIILFDVYIAQM